MFSGLDNIISAAHSSTYYRRSNNPAVPDRRVICNCQSETLMAKWDKTMKFWYKILWITTAIVPFAVIALAWQYAESSFFFLLQCSIWWIMLWSAAAFIMQFVVICRKHSRKKAIQWLIAVVALYGLLLLIAGIILYFCGVIKL